MNPFLKRLPELIFLIAFLTSCTSAARTRLMIRNMNPMMDKMSIATNHNADVETVRRAMPASLIQLDGFIEADPENQDLQELTHDDIQALFFSTSSWLSYMGLGWKFDMSIVKDRPKVLAMMDRLLALDETFNYGAIHVMLGAYYAAKPMHMGGDLELSREHFDKAFLISESKFLPWLYMFAKFYCVQSQDRKLFEDTINRILTSPVDLLPEKTFANEAVKQKTRRLMKKADIFFEKDGAYLKKHLYL